MLSDYFTKGFTYLEIQELLRVYHQQTISLSTIKRHLKKLNLFRHPLESIRTDDAISLAAVREELSGSGSNIGYRRVWAHLQKTDLKDRREDVRRTILQNDPDGVSKRKRRKLRRRKYFSAGPNYSWHWWPWQAKTAWFFVAWMHRWLFKETNMAWSIIVKNRKLLADSS